MSNPEDRDRLLGFGRLLAAERIEFARQDPAEFPALSLRFMRRSNEPLDRAAAWLVWAQRRPRTFLRLAGRSLSDRAPLVRAAVMEGVGLAGIFLGVTADALEVAPLLDRGAADPERPVQAAAAESRALLARFAEAMTEEDRHATPVWQDIRRAILERLIPELRFSVRELLTRLESGLSGAAPPLPALGLGFSPGSTEPELLRMLEELAPIVASVAAEASTRRYLGREVAAFEQAARGDSALAAGVQEIQAVLDRHGRRSPTALEALAAALGDVPGSPTSGGQPSARG